MTDRSLTLSEFFALLRAMLGIPADEFPPRPRGCCGPWPRPAVLIVIFVVVVAAMVTLTIAGVPFAAAIGVVLACAAVTVGVVIRLFGSGPATA